VNTNGIPERREPHVLFDAQGPQLPLARFAELRKAPVVALAPHEWLVAGHRECLAVVRDPRFSSNPAHVRDYERVKDRLPFTDMEHVILTMDPPDHTRLRRLVSRAFTPAAVARLEPWVRGRVVELLDAFDDPARVEAVGCFAEPLPISVIARLLGVDDDDRFARWGREMVAGIMPAFLVADEARRRSEEVTMQVAALLADALDARHRAPSDDLLGQLGRAEAADDRLSPDELIVMCVTLLVAGFVTTVNLIGNGIALLAEHPDVVDALRDDSGAIGTAVEEMLRLDGGTVSLMRFATADVELGGVQIERGDPVTVLVASANRDPGVFDAPDRFDPRRANASQHLNFGGGIHLCLGAPLARLEARVAFEELLARYDRIEVDGEPVRSRNGLRGYTSLPVRLRVVAR
jgi:cytochrome P450